MPDNRIQIMNIENELETFRIKYDSTKVDVSEDYLQYDFRFFYSARKAASQANALIEKMGLNLVAIHAGKNSFFIVKSMYNSDI